MKTSIAFASLIVAALAPPASAQMPAGDAGATPRIDARQSMQQQRIEQGVQSGQLTQRETARLESGQAHVQKVEDKARADGVVTEKERARIHQAQAVQSRHIARQTHDRQRDMNHDGRQDRKGNRGRHLGQKKHGG